MAYNNDTTFQLQQGGNPGPTAYVNAGPVQTDITAALALAATIALGQDPVRIVGVQSGQELFVLTRGNG